MSDETGDKRMKSAKGLYGDYLIKTPFGALVSGKCSEDMFTAVMTKALREAAEDIRERCAQYVEQLLGDDPNTQTYQTLAIRMVALPGNIRALPLPGDKS